MSIITNKITAGDYRGIAIQYYKTPAESVGDKMEALTKNIGSTDLDDLLGQLLYNIGLSYLHHLCFEEELYEKNFQMAVLKEPSEAMAISHALTEWLWDVPYRVTEGGIGIDVDRNIYMPVSLDGDKGRVKDFMTVSGIAGSAWEHRIFETFFATPSVSAVKLLKYANQQGIPIHQIDRSNINQILPTLDVSYDVKEDIQNAVNAGKTVTISQTEVQYYEWRGLGYVILDPVTGAGAYMISGGLAGSGTAKVLTDPPKILSKESWEYKYRKALFIDIVIVNAAALVGVVKYKTGGTTREAGFDCSGFTQYLYDLAGYKIPRRAIEQYEYFKKNGMLFSELEDGDLFFWKDKDGHIYHTGLAGGVLNGEIGYIHSPGTDRYIAYGEMPINGPFWSSNIAGYGRVIE